MYSPVPQDIFTLGLFIPCSSSIPILLWNRFQCDFILFFCWSVLSESLGWWILLLLHNHKINDMLYLKSPIGIVGLLEESLLFSCTKFGAPLYKILDLCCLWLLKHWNLPMVSCCIVPITSWSSSHSSVRVYHHGVLSYSLWITNNLGYL